MQLRINPLLRTLTAPADAVTVPTGPRTQSLKVARREAAREAVGELVPGLERVLLTRGQFSMIEFLEALAELVGPSRFVLATWTALAGDVGDLYRLHKAGLLTEVRWLFDTSFPRREPAAFGQVRDLFGPESARVFGNHAKFALFRGERFNVGVFTSANLNMNPRCEHYAIREDTALADWLEDWVDHHFATLRPPGAPAAR